MRIVLENTDNTCRERTPIPPSPTKQKNTKAAGKSRILNPNQSYKNSSKKGVVGNHRCSFDNTNNSIREDPISVNSRDDPKSINSRDDPKSFNSRDSMDSQNTQVLPFTQSTMSVRNGSAAVSHKLSAGVASTSSRGNIKPKAGNSLLPRSLLH